MIFDTTTHPSYGLIKFNRSTCGGNGARLFGSSIDSPTVISLTIHHAEIGNEFSRDWYFNKDLIVEIDLSPAQFAQLLTTMNVGTGVPCTLKYIEKDDRITAPPVTENIAQRTKFEFKEITEELSKKLSEVDKQAESLLRDKTVSKGQLKGLIDKLNMAITEIKHNMPYVLSQFEDHTNTMVTEAKAEVDAFVTMVVEKTGLEKLKSDKILLGGNNE